LLRNRGRSTHAAALYIVFGGDLDLAPIEAVMLIEARVFCGDYGVLEIGGDLFEGNEPVALVIRRVVNPGLHSALDVHYGCGWINPPHGNEDEHGKRPKQSETECKKESKGAKKAAPLESFVSQDRLLGTIQDTSRGGAPGGW